MYFCPVVSSSIFFSFLLLFSSPNFSGRRVDVYHHTWYGLGVNLRCRSETCCTRLAGEYRTQKSRQKSPSGHHRTTSSGYIFATKTRIDNRKTLLSSNMSSTCPHNMVNFGPLTAEIDWRVWGTPSYFNGYRVLAALLHGI